MSRILAAAVGFLLMSGCVTGSEGGGTAPESSRYVDYHDEHHSFDVTYPEDWSRAKEQLTILGNPNELLALATFPLVKGGGCAPKGALARAGSTDVIVFLVEFTATKGKKLSPRPATFEPLPQTKMSDCWDAPVSSYLFRDSSGRFQADVWLGDEAASETKEEVIGILDSLRFATREQTGTFFERVAAVLAQRGLGELRPPTQEEERRAAPLRELRAKVRRSLAQRPNARLIDVTLGVFTSGIKRLPSYRKLMYVVHTGPFATGDCLEFYDALTVKSEMGSCFLTERDL